MPDQAPLPPYVASLELDGESFVRPSFDGYGLANLAPTVLHALTGSGQESTLPALAPEVLPGALLEEVRTVVVLVVDGLGDLQLRHEIAAGTAPALRTLVESAENRDEAASYATLTTVFPSTTVAALGAVNSGATPAQHGLLGYTQYVEELGGVCDMIRWGPLIRRGSFADAALGGHAPEGFFWASTLYQQLHEGGILRASAVSAAGFAGTGLTRMLHQGANYQGYAAPSSIAAMVPRLVRECHAPERGYIFAYWSAVDSVAHHHGPQSEEHAAEVAVLDRALERLLDALPVRGDTLLLITADHGHVQTSPADIVLLDEFPTLMALLAHPPAGERRAIYLHARPGEAAHLEAVAREVLSPFTVILGRVEAISLGLFGPEPIERRAISRIGDVIALPRGARQLAFRRPDDDVPTDQRLPAAPAFLGVHGGLSREEALVPLLALRV